MHSPRIAIPALLAFAVSASAQGILPSKGQVVAGTGDQVPGLPPAVLYNNPENPVMDLNGNLLFSTSLTGAVTTIDNRALLYGRTKDDLVVIGRSGGPEPTGTMPGVNLIRWISATTPAANAIGSSYRISPTNGFLLWGSGLTGTGIVNAGTTLAGKNDSALFWGPVGAQQVLVQRGMFAPSGGAQIDTAFTSISGQPSSMNSSGTACFQVALVGGDVVTSPISNAAAWVIGTPGNLQWMLRRGDTVNVAGGTARIGTLGFNVQMNEAGFVLHDEKLSTAAGTTTGTATVTTTTDGLVMLYLPGGGHLILAREGDAAPGTAGASYLTFSFSQQALQRSGRMIMAANLVGGDVVGTTNDIGIYAGDIANGFTTLVIRRGDAAPGGAPGETLSSMGTSSMVMNDSGKVAFIGFLTGPSVTTANDAAIFTGAPGNLQIAVRKGMAAPGFANAVITGLVQGTGSPHFNNLGQMVFGCDVTINGTTTQGATYGYDPNQGLVLLSTAGDVYTTVSGTQTANGVDGGIQFNNGDGSPLTLNNNGDLVRRVSSGNGIGVVVRGMLGGLNAKPASVNSNGGTQNWEISAGASHAFNIYVVLGSQTGTRPGFLSPLGPQTIPLSFDPWTQLSLDLANGAVYTNSLGFLDAAGNGTASFNLPPGFSAFFAGTMLHHAVVTIDINLVSTFVSQPASLKFY